MSADATSALAAFMSFLATCAAAWATWKAPIAAAKLAEQMRRQTQEVEEKRRIRLWVFSTVMSYRSQLWNPECVRALNLIDFAYSDTPEVRRAWARLLESYKPDGRASENEKRNLLRGLLERMSEALDLTGKFDDADFDRVYYPTAMQETDMAQMLQRQTMIRSLGQGSPAANTANIFPPRPT